MQGHREPCMLGPVIPEVRVPLWAIQCPLVMKQVWIGGLCKWKTDVVSLHLQNPEIPEDVYMVFDSGDFEITLKPTATGMNSKAHFSASIALSSQP